MAAVSDCRLPTADCLSNNIRNDAVFEHPQPVLQRQLLLFHPLNLQRVAIGGDHRGDCGVEIGMFLLESCKLQPSFGLILIRHNHRLRSQKPKTGPMQKAPGSQSWPAAMPLPHSLLPGNATTLYSTIGKLGGRVSSYRHVRFQRRNGR